MRHEDFWLWLEQYFRRSVVATRFSNVRRVEAEFGDLDAAFDRDRLAGVLVRLTYGLADEQAGTPNPTSIPIVGSVRKGLATLKAATKLYLEFRTSGWTAAEEAA